MNRSRSWEEALVFEFPSLKAGRFGPERFCNLQTLKEPTGCQSVSSFSPKNHLYSIPPTCKRDVHPKFLTNIILIAVVFQEFYSELGCHHIQQFFFFFFEGNYVINSSIFLGNLIFCKSFDYGYYSFISISGFKLLQAWQPSEAPAWQWCRGRLHEAIHSREGP